MKSYPSISRVSQFGIPIYAFDKLDGSLIRAEWSRKQKKFIKFGRKNGLLDHSNPILLEAPEIIRRDYEDVLSRKFIEARWQNVVAFFEFFGFNSFAGNHISESHMCTLFDVSVDKKGLLEPRDFLQLFEDVRHASLLYHGNFNHELQNSVQNGELPGMTFEGIVCKGKYISPGMPLMFKVKNKAWLNKLRTKCGKNDSLFNELQ